MSTKLEIEIFQAAMAQPANEQTRAQDLFNKQKAYFASDATKTYEWRIDQLNRLIRMLKDNYKRFSDASCNDFKTAVPESAFEVSASIASSEFTKSQLKEWMRPVEAPIPKFLAASGHKGVVYREPYGVTLIICPFNGPLLLSLRPAVAALSAGNPCMLKLSEALLATDELLQELIPKYFEPESLSAVLGSRETVTELLKLPFDFIFLTGSVPVGKVVMRPAAENLTPVVLELGGQNPAIVDETADIADAAKKIVWGKTAWGGQWCTSPGYAIVHESIAEKFVTESIQALKEMYGENPHKSPDYSRIVSLKELQRLVGLLKSTNLVAGGDYDESDRYLAPTLLYPVKWTDEIMDDEIFGPILPIIAYEDLKESIMLMKSKGKPLAGFIFSTNDNNIKYFLNSLSFGGGAVNQVNIHLYIESMPFGGVGSSGIGNYYGKYGFDTLSHAKSILYEPSGQTIDHLIPPYTKEKIEVLNGWFEY